jgi:exodeoxyribonuclease III
VGDFNVAPEPIDVYDPEKLNGSVGFHPKEHETLSNIKSWGFIDVYRKHNPDEKAFTFWDYRIRNAVKQSVGWRIDHIWATKSMAETSKRAWIDLAPRHLQKPSDHTVIVAEFNLTG